MARAKATAPHGHPTGSHGTSDSDWLTVAEFAGIFRVSGMTVLRMIDSGDLAAVRLGPRSIRIPRSEVDRLMTGAA